MSGTDGLLLGIDVGTSSMRAALFDRNGRLRGMAKADSGLEQPSPDRAEMDPEGWWSRLPGVLRECSLRAGARLSQVAGLGISSIFPAVTPVDSDGRFLRKAILYCDNRSEAQTSRLRDVMGPQEWVAQTGNVVRGGVFSLASMLWVRDREPDVYRRTHYFLNGNSCLALRLTGRGAMDWTNASETGLFDLQNKKEWSTSVCRRVGFDPAKLPPLIPSWVCGGTVTREAAARTGLVEGIPVAWGGGDVICSAVGSGVTEPGEFVVVSGTTDVVAYCSQSGPFSEKVLNICHVLPDRYIHMGVLLSSGRSVEWLLKKALPQLDQGHAACTAEMIEVAARVPPGAEGMLFLPHLEGEYTAPNDRTLRGAFIGLHSTTDWRYMLRAVLEGVTFQLRLVIETMEEIFGRHFEVVPLVGGTTRSDPWNQIKADVLGRTVEVQEFPESTVLGAALLGGMAAGVFPDAGSAVRPMALLSAGRTFSPDPERARLYEQLYQVYRKAGTALGSSFHMLHDFRTAR